MKALSESKSNEVNTITENVVLNYRFPDIENNADEESSIPDNISKLLSGEREFTNSEILSLIDRAKNETILLCALDALPRFVTSDSYKEWRASEMRKALTISTSTSALNITIPEILAADPVVQSTPIVVAEAYYTNENMYTEMLNQEVQKADFVVRRTSTCSVESTRHDYPVAEVSDDDCIEQALKHVDYLEIDRILHSGSWLFAFVAAVENLPICITLSTARKDRIGFPLIYVNRYFETTSGYTRSDIMGANCKFLQRNSSGLMRSESDSVDRLANALRNAERVKVAITNFKRDGTPFKNLLALKPVFDLKGEYQYVIGVQFDISSQRSSAYSLRLVDSLVNLLPSVVSF